MRALATLGALALVWALATAAVGAYLGVLAAIAWKVAGWLL